MKRLALALWSMMVMLFLGIGTVWAQQPTAPTFSQTSGTELEWGTSVQLEHNNEDDDTYSYLIFVTVNGSEEFVTKTGITQNEMTSSYAVQNFGSLIITGPVTIKAAVAKTKLNSNEDIVIEAWSDITTASYAVTADATRPTAPTFAPTSGEVPAGSAVHLTNGTESQTKPDSIYYNYKGTTTNFKSVTTRAQLATALKSYSKNLIAYDAAKGIEITQDRPIVNAATASIDESGNVTWSEVVTTYFKMGEAKPSAPIFSIDGGTVDENSQLKLTMTALDQAHGGEIWYVINGTGNEFNVTNSSGLPRESSDFFAEGQLIQYSSQHPITFEQSQTIHAAVVWEEGDSDMGNSLTWSEVVKKEFNYTGPVIVRPATPVINPGNDANVRLGQEVTISCTTEGAKIYYTTDDSEPTTASPEYTAPFQLTEDMLISQMEGKVYALRIKAIAVLDGTPDRYGATAGYNVYPNAPTFTPDGSEEVGLGSTVEVTMTCVPSVAKIYYTTDGTTPDDEGSNATLYTVPVPLSTTTAGTTTIKARAILGQYTGSTTTATYTVVPVVKPTITADRNYAYTGFLRLGDQVELSCTTGGAKIYYTLDGSEPTAASTEYTGAITMTEDTVMKVEGVLSLNLKAIAIKGDDKSNVATLTIPIAIEKLEFRVDGEEEALWPGATEVAAGAKVMLTTEPAGLDIYYTTDGTIPTKQSTQYTAEGITVNKSQIIIAVAYNGDLMSYDPTYGDTPEAYAFLIKSGEGETATVDANVFPALPFTPETGATVKAGQELNFTVPEGLAWSANGLGTSAYMFYTDKDGVELECTAEELSAALGGGAGPMRPGSGETVTLPFYIGMYEQLYDENYDVIGMGWSSAYPVIVPEDATGTITFRARFAVMIGESLVYSPEMTATYTVDGAVEKPTAPTFYAGDEAVTAARFEVAAGTAVTMQNGYAEDDYQHVMFYTTTGTTEDFITDVDQLMLIVYGAVEDSKLMPYYGDIEITEAQTILAATAKLNMATKKATWSDIVTVEVLIAKAVPMPTVTAGHNGAVEVGQTVTLACTDGDATIYYTTDGTEPTAQSTKYESAFDVAENHLKVTDGVAYFNLKAMAIKGEEVSNVAVVNLGVRPDDPVFTPDGYDESGWEYEGVAANTQVTITATPAASKIYYTTDGTIPTEESTLYAGPITMDKSKLIIAVAINGEYSSYIKDMNTPTVAQLCIKEGEGEAATINWEALPEQTFTPAEGDVEAGSTINFTFPENFAWQTLGNGAFILYTFDEDVELESDPNTVMAALNPRGGAAEPLPFEVGYYSYYGDGEGEWLSEVTIPDDASGEIHFRARLAISIDNENFLYSPEMTAIYNEEPVIEVATPVITPGSGEVEKGTEVTITCATEGAYIVYTLDGSTPTMASNVYKKGEPIVINEALTLKAAATVQGKFSAVAEATYTIKGGTTEPEKDTVATPTFNPAAGEVVKGTKVAIACATEGAKIYYTVDGSEPTAESTEYTAAITIDEALTIKAIAIKGETKSAVAEATYTIKTANEGLELAGVSVYPNPSDGEFTLELPVSATVEVFASTGVLVYRLETGAGLMTLNIDRSGIYFLRITGEGRTTVKRVIVR